ncbi:hypothetical protein [Methylobacterium planeticum]|uniref:Uncharacterized protein n=1 Tax=Methylobacterium planeticum TaxID=2615211 RepID=A0A6N6MI90_9HYPH|nr:hypothetical protein [Methylobacterium planeticum]KAB1069256.1 hypothetical protein F6X51_25620 [Methylobacterium planeticum]
MSIIAYAIRTCLGAALVDKTLAQGRVYDSAVQPIEEMVNKQGAKPFIVISTDDEKLEVKGWATLDAPRSINIVIEIAVGGIVQVDIPPEEGGGQALRLDIPHTDEGLETALNMIGRQIWREIQVGGPWSDLLREIAFWPKEISITRGANAEQGIRYAARQYVIQADTIAEPDFGAEPEGSIARLLALMAADPRLSKDVPLLEGMIVGEPLPEWRRRQADLGLSAASYRALGLGPLFAPEGEPLAQRMTIVRPDRTTILEAEPTP